MTISNFWLLEADSFPTILCKRLGSVIVDLSQNDSSKKSWSYQYQRPTLSNLFLYSDDFYKLSILWAFVVPKLTFLFTREDWSTQSYSINSGHWFFKNDLEITWAETNLVRFISLVQENQVLQQLQHFHAAVEAEVGAVSPERPKKPGRVQRDKVHLVESPGLHGVERKPEGLQV